MAIRSRKALVSEPPVIDIYARISRSKHDRPVQGQVEDCTEEIIERGATVGKVFRDVSKSAWERRVVRPDFQLLMERLRGRESDGVMVYDLTRFSRKPREGE